MHDQNVALKRQMREAEAIRPAAAAAPKVAAGVGRSGVAPKDL